MFNIIADDWHNGKYVLNCHVFSRALAEYWCKKYRDKYEGKLYLNGKERYKCKNFRVVEIPINI